jgi:hypothetical protein
MATMASAHDDRIQSEHFLGKLTRIHLHGFIAFAVLLAIAYIVNQLLPVFDITGSRFVAFLLSLLAIVIVPPLAGSLILCGLFPLLGKHDSWREMLGWDDRLLSEVSSAKEKAQVVIIR